MKFYPQNFTPDVMPSGYVGKSFSQDIKLMPNQGTLTTATIVGESNGLTVVFKNAAENLITLQGIPLSAGDIPINIRVINSVLGESFITY